MDTLTYMLIVALLVNVVLAYAVIILLSMYLRARRFRDEWRDQATDTLAAWRSTLPDAPRLGSTGFDTRRRMDA